MLFSTVYFEISVILAMLLYPNYNQNDQFLSALGVGSTALLFNPPVIVIGLFTCMIFLFIGSFLRTLTSRGDEPVSNLIIYSLQILGVILGALLIGVGVFVSDKATGKIHNTLAISYFLLLIPVFFILSIPLYKSSKILSGTALLVVILTTTGLFLPGVNQHIFQKLVVQVELIFFFLFTLKIILMENSKPEGGE